MENIIMDLEMVKRIDNNEMEKILEENGLKVSRRNTNELIDLKWDWVNANGYEYSGGKNLIKKGGN